MKVTLVPGTHAWDGEKQDWYSRDSAFVAYLRTHKIELLDPVRPFVWSTRLGGVGFGDDDLLVWKAAGINLFAYLVPPRCPLRQVPSNQTIVVSHSHGLQVVLFAAAAGLKIDTFVDVAGPVRKDMMKIAEAARPNIRRWVHVHAGRRDRWQVFGAMFDGQFGIVREHPLADKNIPVPQADHGEVLRDATYFSVVGDALKEAA